MPRLEVQGNELSLAGNALRQAAGLLASDGDTYYNVSSGSVGVDAAIGKLLRKLFTRTSAQAVSLNGGARTANAISDAFGALDVQTAASIEP